MHKSIKVFGMLAIAGLIAAGGSAYTARMCAYVTQPQGNRSR
jgi:hypothetical protein